MSLPAPVSRVVDTHRTVQELLGHSDIQTTARYLHSDARTKQTAVDKLDGLLGAERADAPPASSATEVSVSLNNADATGH